MRRIVTHPWILLLIMTASLIALQGQACSFSGSTADSASSQRCQTPAGVSGSPTTIEEAITLINALPKPVTLNCFLESLSRPLQLYATQSASSAQPSQGARSPRIFILNGALVMSVVPEGPGASALEFSLLKSETRSLKGEIRFPINASIGQDEPFRGIRENVGTSCQLCHFSETRDTSITYADAFISDVIRPISATRVDLNYLKTESNGCDLVAEPGRCKILRAVFSHGNVIQSFF